MTTTNKINELCEKGNQLARIYSEDQNLFPTYVIDCEIEEFIRKARAPLKQYAEQLEKQLAKIECKQCHKMILCDYHTKEVNNCGEHQ